MVAQPLNEKRDVMMNEVRRLLANSEYDEALQQVNEYLNDNADDWASKLLKVEVCLEAGREYVYINETLRAAHALPAYARQVSELNKRRKARVEEFASSGRAQLPRHFDAALNQFESALLLEADDPSVPFAIALALGGWVEAQRNAPPVATVSFFATPEWKVRAWMQRAEKMIERCLTLTRERSQPADPIYGKATQKLVQVMLEQPDIHPDLMPMLTSSAAPLDGEVAQKALVKMIEQACATAAQLIRNHEMAAAEQLIAACAPFARYMPMVTILQAEHTYRVDAPETHAPTAARFASALKTPPRWKTGSALSGARRVLTAMGRVRTQCPHCFRETENPDKSCAFCGGDLVVRQLMGDSIQLELKHTTAWAHVALAELYKTDDPAAAGEHLLAAMNALGADHRAHHALETMLTQVERPAAGAATADHPAHRIAAALKGWKQADGMLSPSLLNQIARLSDERAVLWLDLPLQTRLMICRRLLDIGALKAARTVIESAFSDNPTRSAVIALRHTLEVAVNEAIHAAQRDAEAKLSEGDPEGAVQIISQTMQLEQNSAITLLRGRARMAAGHDAPALEDFYRVVATADEPDIIQQARKGIAALLEKRWDLQGAASALASAEPDADVQAAVQRVERRKHGSPYLLIEQTDERVIEDSLKRQTVDPYYYATFAVIVREVGRPNMPYQIWMERLFNANFEFVQVLGAFRDLLMDVTFGLRIICTPHPHVAERGQIKIALLARVADRNAESARAQAMQLWSDLRSTLPLTHDGVYIFEAVADESELHGLLKPFEIDHAAEIVRRESSAETDGVYAIAPFVPGSVDLHNILWVMLRQTKPTLLSLHLKPTQLFSWERDAALFSENAFAGSNSGHGRGNGTSTPFQVMENPPELQPVSPEGVTMPGMMTRLNQFNQLEKSRIHYYRVNMLRSAFLLRVNVAGQGGASQLLPEMIGSAMFAPMRDNGETGGYDIMRAMRGAELDAAKRNLVRVEVERWGHTTSPDKTRRLRFLMTEAETANLFRLPIANYTGIPGMRTLDGKPIAPPVGMPENGTVLGVSAARTGSSAPAMIRQSRDDRRRHTYIVGKTGMGKSTLIASSALQDIEAGYGVFLLDPHGDLVEDVLMRIPKHRADDVIVIDPSDEERPVGLNILNPGSEADRHRITNDFIGMLLRMYDPYNQGIVGPIFQQYVRNAMLAAMCIEGGTLIDVYRLLSDSGFVRKVLPKITDPIVKNFWEDIASRSENASAQWRAELLPYLLSKFSRFVEDSILRRMLGQPRSSVPWGEVMDEQKIVLVNLAKGRIGSETSQFLGLLILGDILQAAFQRSKLPPARRKDFYIYIDEVQNYSTPLLSTMISEGRKFGVSLVLANQFLHQLDHGIREAVFGNVGTIVAFRVGVQDAPALSPEFYPVFTAEDLIELGQFTASVKLLVNGVGGRAFTMRTLLPSQTPNPVNGDAIRQQSRMRYGTDIAQIEREINAQF